MVATKGSTCSRQRNILSLMVLLRSGLVRRNLEVGKTALPSKLAQTAAETKLMHLPQNRHRHKRRKRQYTQFQRQFKVVSGAARRRQKTNLSA